MKKTVLILMLLFSISLFAKSEEGVKAEAEPEGKVKTESKKELETGIGDVSGNDLNPVIRGLHFQISGGILGYVGKAGGDNAGSPLGSTLRFNFGYDISIKNAVNIGIALSLGMLQFNANENDADLDQEYKNSPWYEDYNPLAAGLDLDITWIITPRWEFGALINFDYYALAKTYKSGGNAANKKTNDGNFAVGGGLIFEYYTYSRHFSIGSSIEFNYIIDFDGMNIIFTPFMKYSF